MMCHNVLAVSFRSAYPLRRGHTYIYMPRLQIQYTDHLVSVKPKSKGCSNFDKS